MSRMVAVLSKTGENVAETAIAMLEAGMPGDSECYAIASPAMIEMAESTGTLRLRRIRSPTVIGYSFSRILPRDRPQPLKLANATMAFDGRIYPANAKNFDAKVAAGKLQLNHEDNAKVFIKETKGDYAFIIAETERLVAGRDSIGMRPLYFGENQNFVALASERKALWTIGVEKSDSFPPGHLALIDGRGFKFTPARTLGRPRPRPISMQDASEKLQKHLQKSVRERVSDLKECAVAFSGGLDSSIIAFLIKNCGVDAHLIHVSLENQPETEHAKKVADELRLPIHSYVYTEEDVQNTVANVLRLIETPDPVQTSIGIPIYWAAKRASDLRFGVMLAGQGADELFAGYRRYVDDYVQSGNQKVQEIIFNDITKMYENNIERDTKICSSHNVELRLPFATFQIAKFALGLPLNLKIEPKTDTKRKLVVRHVATNLGLEKRVIDRPKRAVQYATGVNNALKNIARNEGLSVKGYLHEAFGKIFKKMVSYE